LIHRGLAGHV